MKPEKISVVGLGRLGLPLALAFANAGFHVIGVDTDQKVLDLIEKKQPPFEEPLLKEYLDKTYIETTTDTQYAVATTDVTIILVPTPSTPSGMFSLMYVLKACKAIGQGLKDKGSPHYVVLGSTVNPGHTDGHVRKKLETWSGKKCSQDFHLFCVPEFVALGRVIEGFENPDFVLIGAAEGTSYEHIWDLSDIYRYMCRLPEYLFTTAVEAEIAKIALNCYVTTKITFANQLAMLCEKFPGVDIDSVTRVLTSDRRVADKYFMGGLPFGGKCFPRDVVALPKIAELAGTRFSLVEAIEKINYEWREHITQRILEELVRCNGTSLGVLGVAYAEGINDTTESFGMHLVDRFLEQGFDVVCYDPNVTLRQSVPSAERCISESDVVVITLPLEEFRSLDFFECSVVVDCWRLLKDSESRIGSAKYIGIGMGK